ncbi:aryl-sulfate sulfotransferase [Christensenellaceae bacterium OttesenSCG-928-K19]|nr:aryl-sulfate sulfotransferase [Christensenellaceae bacterium OttesenSCG-928-K19]
MNNLRNRKIKIWVSCLSLLCVILLFVAAANITAKNADTQETKRMKPATQAADLQQDTQPASAITEDPNLFEQLAAEAQDTLQHQQAVDESLLGELDSHAYTWDNPLIITDPYGQSPLAALALFETNEAAQISVSISGKTRIADVAFTFPGYNTRHVIPIYGLYADSENQVVLTADTAGGQKEQTLSIRTEPLPGWLADLNIITRLSLPESYTAGFNFTYQPKSAYDANGDFRWYFSDFDLLRTNSDCENGRMIVAKGSTLMGAALLYEVDLLGRVYNIYYSPYGVHHDIVQTDDGTLLITGSDSGSDQKGQVFNMVYELNPADGKIINTLDLSTVLQRTRANNTVYWPHDWFHNNSIVALEGSKILVSGRHQSAVVKLDWPSGEIDWILSAPEGWNELFHPYLLQPVGSGFEWQVCQHTPTLLPDLDNNSDTTDILLLDNGTNRVTGNDEPQRQTDNPGQYSRAVHYRIDEKAGTVEQIWQFGKELGSTYYSERCGNAMRLENGSVFISFDVSQEIDLADRDPLTIYSNACVEVLENGDIVWESYLSNRASGSGSYENFKTTRRSFYGDAEGEYPLDNIPGYFVPEQEATV